MTEVAEQHLAGFRAAVAELIGQDRGGFDDDDRLAFLTGFEQLRNQLTQVDHDNVTAVDSSGLVERWMAKSTAGLLSRLLHVSMAEADRRVDAAHTLKARTSMTGERVAARYPRLAEVERSGWVRRENRSLALGCLRELRRKFGAPTDVLDRADQTLAGYAVDLDPAGLRLVCAKIVDAEYPDGLLPDDGQVEQAREVKLKPRTDGSYTLSGTLTGECGAKLAAVLDTYARPAPSTGPDGTPVRDPRSHGQRQHDGLQTACEALLRSGMLPDHGGVPASVIVTIALADLFTTSTYCPGRSFPGCHQPPSHCERHHIVAWAEGGLTTVTNLTLVCGYHHRSFGRAGWTVALRHGLPAWTPPYWLDPQQKPMVHPRIVINARHLKRLRT